MFLITTVGMLMSTPPITYAQENASLFSQLESGLLLVPNPFKSQLPQKVVIKPKVIEPPVKPRPSEPSRSMTMPPPLSRKSEPSKSAVEVKPVVEVLPPKLTINGIIWNTDRPQAIVNGKIVDIGDIISKVKITDIRKSGIEGIFLGKPVTIKP